MDFADVIAGIDFLSEKGIVDPDKIGIMGWSYGGYLAAWGAVRTHRFKAVSIGAAITDLVSMYGMTEIPTLFREYFGGDILMSFPFILNDLPYCILTRRRPRSSSSMEIRIDVFRSNNRSNFIMLCSKQKKRWSLSNIQKLLTSS